MSIHPSSRTLLVALLCSIAAHAFVVYKLSSAGNHSLQTPSTHVVSVTVQAITTSEPATAEPAEQATTIPVQSLLPEQMDDTSTPAIDTQNIVTTTAPNQLITTETHTQKTPDSSELSTKIVAIKPPNETVVEKKKVTSIKAPESLADSAATTSKAVKGKTLTAMIPSITRPAQILRKVNPEYPKKARRRELEGTVILVATISAQGHIESLSLDQSSGHSVLDTAATDAVKKWTFEPALVAGQPESTSLTVPVRFSLTNP